MTIDAVSRNRSVFVHSGRLERGRLAVGDLLLAQVDRACRRRAQANHTATHLLQAALKQVVDPGIGQAGSLVDFDRLRFDCVSLCCLCVLICTCLRLRLRRV